MQLVWYPQTAVKWNDVYALASASATDLVDLVSRRGGGGIASSKMCISLLRVSPLNTAESYSSGTSGGFSGRRRSSDKGGGVQMEALQISGPPGVFEAWKVGGVLVAAAAAVVVVVVVVVIVVVVFFLFTVVV